MVSQLQMLSKILDTKDFSAVESNNLTSDYFFNYQAEFNFIKNHYEQYRTVPDKLTFLNVFPNFEIVSVSEPMSYLLNQLYTDYNTSYLASRFNHIKKLLESDKTADAMKYFTESVEGLHTGEVLTCTNLLTDQSRFDHYLEKTVDRSQYYLPTGFQELDELIGGIDRENENMVISARPGQGKTQCLLRIAANAAKQHLTVGIYEGEMSADKTGYRIDTFLGNIRNSSMNRGDLYIKQEYEQYMDSLKANLNGLGAIKVMTPNDVPGGKVTVNVLKTFIEQEHLDILFVDQYSLLDDDTYHGREFEQVSEIAKKIKRLQVEKHIPIISVSQMNRNKNEDGSQDTSQISLSDKIPQYATVLIMLEQKEQPGDTAFPVKLVLNIVKSRDGGDHKKLSYAVNFNTGNWQYIPEDLELTQAQINTNEQVNQGYQTDMSDTPF